MYLTCLLYIYSTALQCRKHSVTIRTLPSLPSTQRPRAHSIWSRGQYYVPTAGYVLLYRESGLSGFVWVADLQLRRKPEFHFHFERKLSNLQQRINPTLTSRHVNFEPLAANAATSNLWTWIIKPELRGKSDSGRRSSPVNCCDTSLCFQ